MVVALVIVVVTLEFYLEPLIAFVFSMLLVSYKLEQQNFLCLLIFRKEGEEEEEVEERSDS